MIERLAVGDVFERRGARYLRWVVEATVRIGGIPHVYLQRIGDPTDVRLLSEVAVSNTQEFVRAPAAVAL